jgi:hypothetical protein
VVTLARTLSGQHRDIALARCNHVTTVAHIVMPSDGALAQVLGLSGQTI